jgi:hypothetical protein
MYSTSMYPQISSYILSSLKEILLKFIALLQSQFKVLMKEISEQKN